MIDKILQDFSVYLAVEFTNVVKIFDFLILLVNNEETCPIDII